MIAVLRRDRGIVAIGLALIAALGWLYLVHLARGMAMPGAEGSTSMTLPGISMDMSRDVAMPQLQRWGSLDLVLTFSMWVVMMAAMMVPSVSPMVLMFTATVRRRGQRRPYLATAIFVSGYLATWTLFSALAALAQWGLHSLALLSAMMRSNSSLVGGLLLLTAGIFQWTPLKRTCLAHCRSPLGFILNEWREGGWGAFRMGTAHGATCVGCCWALMSVLFVVGVMNLFWVAMIALFVLLEKVVPAERWLSRSAGVVLVGAAVWMLTARGAIGG